MKIFSIIVQVILALDFLMSGSVKIFRAKFMVEHWQSYQYPMWLMGVIGALEIAAAIGMAAGIRVPNLAVASGSLLVILMAGAIYTHIIKAGHPLVMASHAAIVLVLAVVVIWFNK